MVLKSSMFLEARLILFSTQKVNNNGGVWHRHKHLQQNENRKGVERSKMRSGLLLGGVKPQPSCGFALYQNAFHTLLHIDLQHLLHQPSRGL
jgi:hypothetical protein